MVRRMIYHHNTIYGDAEVSFYKKAQVSGFGFLEDSMAVAFDVQNIDSLGQHLYPWFNKDFFRFHYNGDTLTITDGNGPPFKDRSQYSCCSFSISITPERKIRSVQKNHRFIKQKGNTVTFYKSRNDFFKNWKDVRVVIVFEPQ